MCFAGNNTCSTSYQCLLSDEILPLYYLCDEIRDCANGDDERFCYFRYIEAVTPENRFSMFPTRPDTNRYSPGRRVEHLNSGFKTKRDCTILVAKAKALISVAVTAKLICAFIFS